MATDSTRLYPNRSDAQLDWIYSGLALFTLFAGLIAALAVFANDLYFWRQSPLYISPYLFGLAFVLGASHRVMGLMVIIAILPLSAGLGQQFNAYLGTSLMTLPNQGLDLASGFFLGAIASYLVKAAIHRKTLQSILSELQCAVPWPIALVMVMVTCSTVLAIARNIYQSATATSVKGVLFNLVHFRPIDWHADFMPISDWVAYALAVSMVGVVIAYLINQPNKVQIIFRPLIVGLLVAVALAIAQARTGVGLPEHLLTFRKDFFGYATIGFQPDLHAFAGHMLLGAIGLIGYLKTLPKPSAERTIVQVTIALCWFGLVLSKSRALLLLALAAVVILMLYSIWKNNKNLLPKILIALTVIVISFSWLISHYSNSFSGIPVLAWLGELAKEFKSRDLTSWSLFSGIFGSRFEIWEAAIRMWWEFPLLGTGQGTFYRYSAIPFFSKSHFLILNNGENAHNYFLQTLVEVGIIGFILLIFSIIYPYYTTKHRNRFIPVLVGLISLFLGNIFSHSFLVRENLLMTAILIGLSYSYINIDDVEYSKNQAVSDDKLKTDNSNFIWVLTLAILIFAIVVKYEVLHKWGHGPLKFGLACYQKLPLSPDGWTSGVYEFMLPERIQKVFIPIQVVRPNLSERNLYLKLDLINSTKTNIPEQKYVYKEITKEILMFTLPEGSSMKNQNLRISLEVSDCYTPRNVGENIDDRKLGVRLDKFHFQ